jgi:hypothetical protein
MAEIVSDIKVDLVEVVGKLGITLSSDDTRIKHTETGVFDISSNGSISISGGQVGSSNLGATVSITGGLGTGNENGGDLTIAGGGGGSGGGKPGRVVCNSLFKVQVFTNDAARDGQYVAVPTTGDICFVINGTSPAGNKKLQVYTGSGEGEGWQICN